MTQHVYRHTRRRRSHSFLPRLVSLSLLLAVGAGVFYGGVNWFRSHAGTTAEIVAKSDEVKNAIAPESVSAAELIPARANLVSAFDGQTTGAVNRMPGTQSTDFHLLAYLPGLDAGTESYAVWLLKDGLADVKRVGELTPRADGSWVMDFTAGPQNGISLPETYRTLVIMKRPKESKTDKVQGTKMAEAKF